MLAEREYENNQLRQTRRGRRAHRCKRTARARSPRMSGGKSRPRSRSCAPRKPQLEEQLAPPATSAPSCSATSTRSSSRPRSSWATERMENALLRERINDIAAEVAKLAMQLEGPNSPIEAHAGGGSRPAPKPAPRPANDASGSHGAAAIGPARGRRHARRAHPRAAGATPPAPASRARKRPKPRFRLRLRD